MTTAPKAPEGHFTILYFASAGSYTKKEHEALQAPLPLKQLFSTLEGRYPGMKHKVLGSCLVTVNLDYVDVPSESAPATGDEDVVIKEGDEVAIIPPVSSG